MWLRFDTSNDDVFMQWDHHPVNIKSRLLESAHESRNIRYTQKKEETDRQTDRQTKIVKKFKVALNYR